MPGEPQWVKRDLPILQCLVAHFGQSDVPIPVEEIAALTGLPLSSVRAGINNLGRASPSYIEYMFDSGTPPQRPMLVTGITQCAVVWNRHERPGSCGCGNRLIAGVQTSASGLMLSRPAP
jgi:hypothetical protein